MDRGHYSEVRTVLKGFRDFIMRGNVLDLAVAVVIGAAFAKVIDALVTGIINPLIAAIFGKPSLNDVGNFTINNANFSIGVLLTALVNFLLVAAAVYFVLIVPVNKLREKFVTEEEAAEAEEIALLKEIRDALQARGGSRSVAVVGRLVVEIAPQDGRRIGVRPRLAAPPGVGVVERLLGHELDVVEIERARGRRHRLRLLGHPLTTFW